MPGRMGGDIVTIQNLEVVKIDAENNILVVEGAVPGPTNSLLVIKKAKKLAKARIPQLTIIKEKKGKAKAKAEPAKKEARK